MGCAHTGGCPADYVAVGITGMTFILLCIGLCFVLLKRRELELNSKKVPLVVVQAFASLLFISGRLMSVNYFKIKHREKHLLLSCNIWFIWLVGPFGFGLLLSCYIAQVYRLYYLFVARRLPPLKYYQLLCLLVLPWFAFAALMQAYNAVRQNPTCSFSTAWQVVTLSIFISYPMLLLVSSWKIRNVHFEFDEFRELLKAVVVSTTLLAVVAAVFIAQKVLERNARNESSRLHVTNRFTILLIMNVTTLLLFWIPISKCVTDTLRSQRERLSQTMGQALGVPHSGYVPHSALTFDFTKPLQSLLEHKQFRASYLAFADSRMAGEIVRFYLEVRELNKLPTTNTVQRVYLAEHIVDNYIKRGSPMEINISHRMRSQILTTRDLADPELFKRTVNESLKMMETNLTNDYWKSTFFDELKAELDMDVEAAYDGLPLSGVKDLETDNPFEPSSSSSPAELKPSPLLG